MTQKVAVSDIAALVAEATRIRRTGEIRFVEFLNKHTLEVSPPPCAPESPAYRAFWEDTHFSILGETYDARRHENFDFDLAQMIECPYPYITKEPTIIAQQVRDWANVLEAIDLPRNSRILEMGAGWGNTSLLLAQSGFEVSVLDINPLYLDLITKRCDRLGLKIDTIEGEFQDITKLDQQYDAVLFYESFHHCLEHGELLRSVKTRLTKGGRVYFAGEPIIENAPYAWGLNPSGEALFQMHTHGWMELIFDRRYFEALLDSFGLALHWKPFAQGTQVAVASL